MLSKEEWHLKEEDSPAVFIEVSLEVKQEDPDATSVFHSVDGSCTTNFNEVIIHSVDLEIFFDSTYRVIKKRHPLLGRDEIFSGKTEQCIFKYNQFRYCLENFCDFLQRLRPNFSVIFEVHFPPFNFTPLCPFNPQNRAL